MPKRGGRQNLYQRNGIWWARVQVDGKDIRRSLFTRDRAEAVRRRKRILDDAGRIRSGDTPRHQYQELVTAWAEIGFGVKSERSRERYRTSLRMMHADFGALFLDQVDIRRIGEFVRERAKVVSNATVRRDLTALSKLMGYGVALGWREDNPAKAWDRSTIPEDRDPITRPDERSIEATVAASSPMFAALQGFLLESGLRRTEAATIKRSDVDWKASQVTVTRKGRRIKTLDLSPSAMKLLRGVPAALNEPLLFWGLPKPRQLSRAFQDPRARAAKRAKAEGWTYQQYRVHDLRHEYAIRYLKAVGAGEIRGSIYDLQLHLGHTSVKTTEIYLDFLTPEEAERAKRARHKSRHRGAAKEDE